MVINNGLGDAPIDCSSYWSSVLNLKCWVQDPLTLQYGVPVISQASDAASCKQAAGGDDTSVLYQQCMSAKASTQAALEKQNPAGLADYNAVMSGDIFSLINPFTGSGPLAPVPSYVWWLVAGVAGLVLLRTR